jgi:hypothetical protein
MSVPDTWLTVNEWHVYHEWLASGTCQRLCLRMDQCRRWAWLTRTPEEGGAFQAGPHRLHTDMTGVSHIDPCYERSDECARAIAGVMAELARLGPAARH